MALSDWTIPMTDLGADPDNLTQFFELIAHNQNANAAKFSTPFLLLRRVNICLSAAGKNLINPKPMMAGVLFLRCQYTFRHGTRWPSGGNLRDDAFLPGVRRLCAGDLADRHQVRQRSRLFDQG
jgi:hypothetical protein